MLLDKPQGKQDSRPPGGSCEPHRPAPIAPIHQRLPAGQKSPSPASPSVKAEEEPEHEDKIQDLVEGFDILEGAELPAVLWLLGLQDDPDTRHCIQDLREGAQDDWQFAEALLELEEPSVKSKLEDLKAVYRIISQGEEPETSSKNSDGGTPEEAGTSPTAAACLGKNVEEENPTLAWFDVGVEEKDCDDDDDDEVDLNLSARMELVEFKRAVKVMIPKGKQPTEEECERMFAVGLDRERVRATAESQRELAVAYGAFKVADTLEETVNARDEVSRLRLKMASQIEVRNDEAIGFDAFVWVFSLHQLCLRVRLKDEMQSITTMFTLIDTGGDGDVDFEDFLKAVELVGLENVDEKELKEAILVAAGDEEACLADFVVMCCVEPLTVTRRFVPRMRYFLDAFSLFDEDGEGEISADELGQAITKLFGWRPTRYESEKLVKSVDSDGSGIIEFNEFVMMMNGTKSADLAKIKDEIEAVYAMFMMFDLDPDGALACFQFGFTEFSKVRWSTHAH